MLSRLPISLAQLKAGNNSEILKTKLGNYCILCTKKFDKKKSRKLMKQLYRSLVDII